MVHFSSKNAVHSNLHSTKSQNMSEILETPLTCTIPNLPTKHCSTVNEDSSTVTQTHTITVVLDNYRSVAKSRRRSSALVLCSLWLVRLHSDWVSLPDGRNILADQGHQRQAKFGSFRLCIDRVSSPH